MYKSFTQRRIFITVSMQSTFQNPSCVSQKGQYPVAQFYVQISHKLAQLCMQFNISGEIARHLTALHLWRGFAWEAICTGFLHF
jgi:hypothetical protein